MCFGLGLIANQSASGTINIPTSSPDARALARLFRRTPKSLAAKLANLDGRRPNGAKFEQQLWIRLTDDILRFESLYALILDVGRKQGLDAELLPDFLGFEDQRLQIIYDADKVSGSDLRSAIEPQIKALAEAGNDIDIATTERALLGTARVGQQQFARKVLSNSGYSCSFCGLSARTAKLPIMRMLIASHIKPWSHSSARERVDHRNGIAACPTHDAAFEGFLFSVSNDGRVLRSAGLESAIDRDARMNHNFGATGLSASMLMPAGSQRPATSYLEWHRERMAATG